MHRPHRLRRRQDFAIVYRTGAAHSRGDLVVRVRPNPEVSRPRFGFAVGRKVGSAVIRNRVRRRLREAARLSGASGGADVVVIARARAGAASYQELERTLRALLRAAGLLPKREPL